MLTTNNIYIHNYMYTYIHIQQNKLMYVHTYMYTYTSQVYQSEGVLVKMSFAQSKIYEEKGTLTHRDFQKQKLTEINTLLNR